MNQVVNFIKSANNKANKRNIFVTFSFLVTILSIVTTLNCSPDKCSLGSIGGNPDLSVNACANLDEKLDSEVNRANTDTLAKMVERRSEILLEEIPFEQVTKYDDTMNSGEKRVQNGASGIKKIMRESEILDDTVLRTENVSEEIVKVPIDEIVYIGTKQSEIEQCRMPKEKAKVNKNVTKALSKNINNNQKSFAKNEKSDLDNKPAFSPALSSKKLMVLNGKATAYTAEPGAITSTGTRARDGVAAVNPNIIPYHSKLEITTTDGSFRKILTAEDTGGALKDGRALVDIYMPDVKSCMNFGKRNVVVKVIPQNAFS